MNRLLRVLLVEDDATSRLILGRVLSQRYDEVASFTEAEQALEWCKTNTPNLVVLDLQLPGMDGMRFSQWIRSQAWGDDVFILIATGSSGPSDLRAVLAAGANDYISKPLDLNSLKIRLTVAEEHLRQVQHRRDAQQINRRILDSAQDGFILMTGNGDIVDVNPAYTRLVGFRREELVGKNISMLELADAQTLSILKTIASNAGSELEGRHRTRDGRIVDLDISVTKLSQDDPRIFAFVRDITHRKHQLEERLRTSKLESIGLLAGGIAHELNNALTAIIGNISLAQAEAVENAPAQNFMGKALDATQRAGALARQLLTFAKGGEPLKAITTLNAVLSAIQPERIGLPADLLERIIADDLWLTDVDEVQIAQVIESLLLNAREASPPGEVVTLIGKNIQIADGSRKRLSPGRYVMIQVTDQGPGVSAEIQHKIFDPYFSTKGSGRGLGLAICYSIVRRHGGLITLDSSGGGTRMEVYLPASEAKRRDAVVGTGGKSRAPVRVLVMDDEPTIRELLSLLLERAGFRTMAAQDGEEALNFFDQAKKASDPIGLAVLDLTIPNGLGGVETTRRLLELQPDLPIIVCSGYSNDPVMANFLEYGFSGRLHKPFTNDQLLQVIQTVLEKTPRA